MFSEHILMKRLLLVLALLSLPSWATIALDGTPVHSSPGGVSSLNLPAFTTTNTNDIVKVVLTINGVNGSSITSPNTTGWTLRKRQADSIGTNVIETWVGTAASALTNEVIAVTLAGSATFVTADAYAISGADTTTKFDSNVSLPASAGGGAVADPLSVSTSNANDFIDGCFRMGIASPTAGAGWTIISGADFQLCEYKVVSSTQSGLSVTIGTGVGQGGAGIADALIATGAAAVSGSSIVGKTSVVGGTVVH